MTVIFNKRLGIIKNAFLGDLQHIDVLYGAEAEDYKQIYDELHTPDDEFIFRNLQGFKVNTETRQLEMLPDYTPRYPMASQ